MDSCLRKSPKLLPPTLPLSCSCQNPKVINPSIMITTVVVLCNSINNRSLMALSCQSWSTNSWCISAALLWQKEASDKSDISCKRAKCVCHFHWRQWNIMMSYLTYFLAGWVFMHTIWPGRRVQQAKYENINNSNFDGMSLASFCQSILPGGFIGLSPRPHFDRQVRKKNTLLWNWGINCPNKIFLS